MDLITQSFLEEISRHVHTQSDEDHSEIWIDQDKLAESLAGKMERFIEWKDRNIFRKIDGWIFHYDSLYIEARWKTLPDLWKYFCDNIEKEK